MTVISARAEEYLRRPCPVSISTSMGSVGIVVEWEAERYADPDLGFDLSRALVQTVPPRFLAAQHGCFGPAGATQEDCARFQPGTARQYQRRSLRSGGRRFYNDFQFDRAPIGTGPFTFGSQHCRPIASASASVGFGHRLLPGRTSFTNELTENRTPGGVCRRDGQTGGAVRAVRRRALFRITRTSRRAGLPGHATIAAGDFVTTTKKATFRAGSARASGPTADIQHLRVLFARLQADGGRHQAGRRAVRTEAGTVRCL